MFSVRGILSVVVVLIPPEDDDTSLVVMFKTIVVSGGVVVETPGIVALYAFMFLLERSGWERKRKVNNESISSCGREFMHVTLYFYELLSWMLPP